MLNPNSGLPNNLQERIGTLSPMQLGAVKEEGLPILPDTAPLPNES
jgi:hypothetical protein